LKPFGILLISDPDSSHQTKNSKTFAVNHKKAIEHLGFKRFLYQKTPHTQNAAYMKLPLWAENTEKHNLSDEVLADLLSIPQDKL